jgi:hypothetical protein
MLGGPERVNQGRWHELGLAIPGTGAELEPSFTIPEMNR